MFYPGSRTSFLSFCFIFTLIATKCLLLRSDLLIWRVFVSIDYYKTRRFQFLRKQPTVLSEDKTESVTHFSFITSKRIYHGNSTSFPALEFLWKQLPLPRLSWCIQGKQDVKNYQYWLPVKPYHIKFASLIPKNDVVYQTREALFRRDIETPRRELKIRRAGEYYCGDSRSKRRSKIVKIYAN